MDSTTIILIGFILVCIIIVAIFEKNKLYNNKHNNNNNENNNKEHIERKIIPQFDRYTTPIPQIRNEKPPASNFKYAYDINQGPYLGEPMNVPVPANSLKLSSEKYKYPFYRSQIPLQPYDFFKPYGPNNQSMQNTIIPSDTPFYYYPRGYTPSLNKVPFISSVNSFSPFPEVNTPWEKTGILTNIQNNNSTENELLNLYRKPIAPLQDLFEYTVQDKNGFIIRLEHTDFLEDGDIIPHITGKNGKWKVHKYIDNKWVWA